MATICFRPPPLPPSKKTSFFAGKHKKQPAGGLLSSTYLSFRDPAEDEVVTNEEIEMVTLKTVRKCRRVSHTNSLSRARREEKTTLTRSHSEGNLEKQQDKGLNVNRYMRALSGSWRNLLNLGGMSRPPKPAATAKKVPPPAVPHEFRHSGSSFGSAGYASGADEGGGGGPPPPANASGTFLSAAGGEPPGVPRDDHSDYGSTASGGTGKSPGPVFPGPAFTFPGQPGGVLTHKAAVYYHHQLSLQEDQGIDMTQSPGRDSPGSSSGSAGSGSRHSTASLDSGRASYHPLGRSTAGSSGSPRCSLSSCSIGSEQGRIERMIHQGVPDQDIIHSWLVDLQFDEYFPLFITAGYDLPTIGRMTPEDLTAIGIKKPNHRKRLKAEIAQLNLPDNLPEFIPGSLEEWLNLLRLDEYLPAFIEQGYQTIDDVTQLTWEDLEEFGIVKLGHQKKIMLAIKRIKDIKAGKRINSDRIYATREDVLVHAPPPPPAQSQSRPLGFAEAPFRAPWEAMEGPAWGPYQGLVYADVVPIKIRSGRGKSLESLEDPSERACRTFSPDHAPAVARHPQPCYVAPVGWRARSYDDGDITPTNESALLYGGGGTLPRPRGVIRPRPVAKVAAEARGATFAECAADYGVAYKTCYAQYGSPLMGKKIPPNPPKRCCDPTSSPSTTTTTVEVHRAQTSSPLPLPAYPSSDSLSISLEGEGGELPLPPPPAPGTPPAPAPGGGSAISRLNQSQSWGADERDLIDALALQHRNGSDASFKSSSSTESDSLPFANENAGTIRTRASSARQSEYAAPKPRGGAAGGGGAGGLPPHPAPSPAGRQQRAAGDQQQAADVLSDIGSMLASLTDELDAMLEEEQRQQ